MIDDLLTLAIATSGGQRLWNTLRGLRVDISLGGPIWAMKGWPPDKTFDQILTVDTQSEHIVFAPFTRPDQQMVFDAATDSVTMQTLDGETVEKLAPARKLQGNASQQRLGRNTSRLFPRLRKLELLHHPVAVHLPRSDGPRNRAMARGSPDLAAPAGPFPASDRHPQPRSGVLLRRRRAAAPDGLNRRDQRQHPRRPPHGPLPELRWAGGHPPAGVSPQSRQHREPQSAIYHARHP